MDNNDLLPIRFTHRLKPYPEALSETCLNYLARHLEVICSPSDDGLVLHEGLVLNRDVCNSLMETYQNLCGDVDDNFASIFRDVTTTNLTSVRIHDSSITDDGLVYLLQHNLYELSLVKCPGLTFQTFFNILKHAKNLVRLYIGTKVDMVTNTCPILTLDDINRQIIESAPKLQVLELIDIEKYEGPRVLTTNTDPCESSTLRFLNISSCIRECGIHRISGFTNLHTLILYDAPFQPNVLTISIICSLHTLVVLDLSNGLYGRFYNYAAGTLSAIVTHLPKLMYLDISGTNLDGIGSLSSESDISGLETRANNPLKFLGIYKTKYDGCERHNIPAKIIGGHANETQLLNAAASCMNKHDYILTILKDIIFMMQQQQWMQTAQLVDVVLETLNRHKDSKIIQGDGSTLLQYVMRMDEQFLVLDDTSIKHRIISGLIHLLSNCNYNLDVIRPVFVTLYHLIVPQDLLFEFKRIVQLLLDFACKSGYVLRIGIAFLSNISFHSTNEIKLKLRDAGVIEKMMNVIKNQLGTKPQTDQTDLEYVWSILWDMTYQLPINCKRFLDENGMDYFFKCLAGLPVKTQLLYLMLGTIANVSENSNFRPRLMLTGFVKVLYDLLPSELYNLKVNYTAAKIFAHLASDGYEAWIVETPTRCNFLKRMTKAIKKWNLNTDLGIDYHSIEQLLELAQVKHTHQCVHFAVWALANLVIVESDKYCPLVITEGGLQIMSELLEEHRKNKRNNLSVLISNLAQKVIDRCDRFLINQQE